MSTFRRTSTNNAGNTVLYGANDFHVIIDLLNGVTSGIPTVKVKSTAGLEIHDSVLKFRNPADSFSTTIRTPAITGNRDLNLPLITGTDTLVALTLDQAMTNKSFDNEVKIKAISSPANPPAGYKSVYVDTADGNIKVKNSSGVVKDLETVGTAGNVTVNGASVTNFDFDNATPAAPAGAVNVKWQKDVSNPANLSAHLDVDTVSNTVLANMAANTIKARAASTTGDPSDLSVGTNTVVGRASGDIIAAQLATAQIADNAVTAAKMADMADARLWGRSAGSAGDPHEISVGTGLSLSGGVLSSQGVTNASYLTLGVDATLANERVFTPGRGLLATDGGAGGNYTLDVIDMAVEPDNKWVTGGWVPRNSVSSIAEYGYLENPIQWVENATVSSNIIFGMGSDGPYQEYAASGASGEVAGVRKTDVTRLRYRTKLFAKFSLTSTTNVRLFLGFTSQGGTFLTGDDALNARHGFMLYVTAGGNFRVAYNDGVGATVFTADLATINTSPHTIYLDLDQPNSRCGYLFDSTNFANITWITTDIPAQDTDMSLVAGIETASTSNKGLRIFFVKSKYFAPN